MPPVTGGCVCRVTCRNWLVINILVELSICPGGQKVVWSGFWGRVGAGPLLDESTLHPQKTWRKLRNAIGTIPRADQVRQCDGK